MASCLRSGGTFSVSLSSCFSSVKAQRASQNARVLVCPVVQENGAGISCGLEERSRRYGWGAQGRGDTVQSGCGTRVLKPTLFPMFRDGKGVVVCGINGKSLEAQYLVQAGDAVVIVDHGSRRPESNVMLQTQDVDVRIVVCLTVGQITLYSSTPMVRADEVNGECELVIAIHE